MRLIHKKGDMSSSSYLIQVKSDFKQASKLHRKEFIKVKSIQIEKFLNDLNRRFYELKDANIENVRVFVPKGNKKDN